MALSKQRRLLNAQKALLGTVFLSAFTPLLSPIKEVSEEAEKDYDFPKPLICTPSCTTFHRKKTYVKVAAPKNTSTLSFPPIPKPRAGKSPYQPQPKPRTMVDPKDQEGVYAIPPPPKCRSSCPATLNIPSIYDKLKSAKPKCTTNDCGIHDRLRPRAMRDRIKLRREELKESAVDAAVHRGVMSKSPSYTNSKEGQMWKRFAELGAEQQKEYAAKKQQELLTLASFPKIEKKPKGFFKRLVHKLKI